MEPAATMPGGWSRMVWSVVVALSAIGMVGLLVTFAWFFLAGEPGFGGCGLPALGIFVMTIFALFLLGFVALNGVLASFGSILLWRRSRWGPLLLIPANFLTMAGFAYLAVRPGEVAWIALVLVFAAAPACAVVLLSWALWTRERGRDRVVELIVLGLIGLPLVALWVVGVNHDVTAALTPPPPVTAPGTC